MTKKALGNFGEGMACGYLQKHGYEIVARNFQTRGGEIDIITKDPSGQLVFVEVKTRATEAFGGGEEAIHARKQHRLRNCALFYLATLRNVPENYRFDSVVVALDRVRNTASIRHVKNIFC